MDITKCAQCGMVLETEANEDNAKRTACPSCGSTAREISVSTTISVSASLTVNYNILSSTNLLLQAVIVPGEKIKEGCLIEAVSLPWFDIIELIRNDPSIVFQISPRKWEEIIAGAYKKAGFDEVILTPQSGDLGRDVIAVKKGIGKIRVIDQVKAYKPGHLVKANDVRALMGVLQSDGASKGFITTTSDFAPKIKEDPLILPYISSRLELINGENLLKRLTELAENKGINYKTTA